MPYLSPAHAGPRTLNIPRHRTENESRNRNGGESDPESSPQHRGAASSKMTQRSDTTPSPSPSPSARSKFSIFTLMTAHPAHVVTYLVCVALFSISFLVFVNSSVSFVITERFGDPESDRGTPGSGDGDDGVGNAVGTLGFADELVTLVACPVWGMMSDRIGVRPVVVAGYAFISAGLVLLVAARNVFPQLLLARLVFSVGAAAMTTMITAMLPTMTYHASMAPPPECAISTARDPGLRSDRLHVTRDDANNVSELGSDVTDESDITITPRRFRRSGNTEAQYGTRAPVDAEAGDTDRDQTARHMSSINAESAALSFRIAGVLGTFAGIGALLALFVFLPLPAFFQTIGRTPSEAIESSYHVVAAIALSLSVFCFFGLRGLPGEEGKTIGNLVISSKAEGRGDEVLPLLADIDGSSPSGPSSPTTTTTTTGSTTSASGEHSSPPVRSYYQLFSESVMLGFKDPDIGLGYLSSFVARSSSVAISLFIPLLVNMYFRSAGRCDGHDSVAVAVIDDNVFGSMDLRKSCPRAYAIAAALTGTSQLVALLTAPVFGYLSSRESLKPRPVGSERSRLNMPLLIAAISGLVGFLAFSMVRNPDPFGVRDTSGTDGGGETARHAGDGAGNPMALLFVSLMGLAQIGATVCGLGLLARGIQRHAQADCNIDDGDEDDNLVRDSDRSKRPACPFRPSTTTAAAASSSSQNCQRETDPAVRPPIVSRPLAVSAHKGTIGSISSLAGAGGILLVTKLGGIAFDKVGRGIPFAGVAVAFAILLVAILGTRLVRRPSWLR